jgi:hypothetical protein
MPQIRYLSAVPRASADLLAGTVSLSWDEYEVAAKMGELVLGWMLALKRLRNPRWNNVSMRTWLEFHRRRVMRLRANV